MQPGSLEFTISFTGSSADRHTLDFYDAAQALIGFQRSLAITTHLLINDKVIIQAPSLKGAKILAAPVQSGSWMLTAAIVGAAGTGLYKLLTAPRDTPLGHLVHSAYDYVISESLGIPVDYEKSLGQAYKELTDVTDKPVPHLSQPRFDSVIDKCENAIKQMHRPIAASESAQTAKITSNNQGDIQSLEADLNIDTYRYIDKTIKSDQPVRYVGKVSSYNLNTFNGRVYVDSLQRPVSFMLLDSARLVRSISLITQSLGNNAQNRMTSSPSNSEPVELPSRIAFEAIEFRSQSGRLKSLGVTDIIGRIDEN